MLRVTRDSREIRRWCQSIALCLACLFRCHGAVELGAVWRVHVLAHRAHAAFVLALSQNVIVGGARGRPPAAYHAAYYQVTRRATQHAASVRMCTVYDCMLRLAAQHLAQHLAQPDCIECKCRRPHVRCRPLISPPCSDFTSCSLYAVRLRARSGGQVRCTCRR